MRYFEIGYEIGNGIFSVNMVTVNTCMNELQAATETAQQHANRHGYTIAYVRELTAADAQARRDKGVPTYPCKADVDKARELSCRVAALEAEVDLAERQLCDWLDEAGIDIFELT